MTRKPTYEDLEQRVKDLETEAAERTRTERALSESEERLRAQYKNIPIPTYTWKKTGDDFELVDYNDAAVTMTHGKIGEWVGKKVGEMYHDVPEVLEDFRRCYAERISVQRERFFYLRTRGEGRYFRITYAFVPPNLVLVHTEDIDDRIRAEEELRKHREDLEEMVEQRTAELRAANRQLEEAAAECELTEERIEHRLALEKAVSAVSSRLITVSNLHDAIHAALGDVAQICGADRAYLFVLHSDGSTVRITREWRREGIPSAAADQNDFSSDRVSWWINRLRTEEFIRIRDTSQLPTEAHTQKEILERLKTGNILLLPIRVNGAVAGMMAFIGRDGPEECSDNDLAILRICSELIGSAMARSKTERALQESELRFRSVFDVSPQPIALTEASSGRLIDVNDTICEISGYAKQEFLGRPTTELFYSREDRERFLRQLRESGEVRGLEMDFRAKDGSTLSTLMFAKAIQISDRPLILTVFVDMTQYKRLQEQLLRAQKLESIGTLAGGIAHDFNNLLMGIQGNTSLMLLGLQPNHPHYQRLKNIEKQVESGSRLTSQLLGYARKGRYQVKTVDLNRLVQDSSEAFGRTRREILIHKDLADNLHAIEADIGQMEQVLWNLYVNAADAMPDGGRLILKTVNTGVEALRPRFHDPKPGDYVLLTLTDTGTGMDKKTLDRIFDPFFTTKGMGRGTGLGLASAYGIIRSHSGHIDVQSAKGRGTTFSIYLPASPRSIREVAEPVETIRKGSGSILVVDDEEVILDVGRDLLEAMGYHVLTARDGQEAVALYGQNQDKIDLVLLDMVMPTMGGGEAYDRIKEINPNARVLLSSGYSIDGAAREILKRGCDGFIQKPFTLKELAAKIEKILEKPRSHPQRIKKPR